MSKREKRRMSKTVKVCLEFPKPMFDLIGTLRAEHTWAACDSLEDYCIEAIRKENEQLLLIEAKKIRLPFTKEEREKIEKLAKEEGLTIDQLLAKAVRSLAKAYGVKF